MSNDEKNYWWTCPHQNRQPNPCQKCKEPNVLEVVYNQECFQCKKIINKIAGSEQLMEEEHDCRPITNEIQTKSEVSKDKIPYGLIGIAVIFLIPIGVLAYRRFRKYE